MFGLAHRAMLLAPSENALDHRPARLRHAVPLMPRGSFVDGAVAVLAGFGDSLVLCHMRRHADGAKIGDMIGGIVRLALTGRDAAAGGFASRLQRGLRSPAFGGAIGMRDPAGHRQPMPVLHGDVAHIAKLGLPSGRLAIEPAVRVAGTRMGVVLALLAVEVGAIIIVATAVLGAKFCDAQASISVPSTEKCSSDNSGLTREWFRSLVMNFVNTSPFCSRSRFLVKMVGSQTGSSGDSPTNQRYKRL